MDFIDLVQYDFVGNNSPDSRILFHETGLATVSNSDG